MPFPSKKHQFPVGRSGNPTGGSKGRRVTAALVAMIEEKQADRSLALVWLNKALLGDRHFFRYLLDRVDGPAVTEPETSAAAEDVQGLRDYLAPPARVRRPVRKKRAPKQHPPER